jgi:hypothetical protein
VRVKSCKTRKSLDVPVETRSKPSVARAAAQFAGYSERGREGAKFGYFTGLQLPGIRPRRRPTDGGASWDQFRAAAIGAEPTVVDALQARNFPLPERQHEIIRDPEGVPVAEADLLYRNKMVVWVQGAPHQQPHVHHRDEDQKRRLKGLGYRVVEIWPDHVDDGLRDLAQRLDRPDLMAV